MKRAKRPFPVRRDSLAEAVRPVYLIASSIQYALGSLLKTESQDQRQELLARLDEDATYLKLNLKLLRRQVEINLHDRSKRR